MKFYDTLLFFRLFNGMQSSGSGHGPLFYLLEGQRVLDRNTINRFRKNILTQEAGQVILRQLVVLLHGKGFLVLKQLS